MTRTTCGTFRDCLDGLDPEERVAFVEAVYEARGWETTRADGDLLVTPPGTDDRRRVAVGEDADAHREMVRYAVDAETRDRLLRTFFDGVPTDMAASTSDDTPASTAAEPPTRPRSAPRRRLDATAPGSADGRREGEASDADADGSTESDASADVDTTDTPFPTTRLLAVGLAVLVVAGGVAAVGPELASSSDDATDEVGVNATETTSDEGRPVAPGVRRVVADEEATPPGVDATGVTSAATLADAHEAALAERSVRLTITYREFENGELRGVAHERAVVASADRYRSRVWRLGSLRHDASVVASGSTYANGSVDYVRTGDGERDVRRSRASPSSVGIVDRTERLVRWYLGVVDSRIVEVAERDRMTHLRIAFEGDPWPESRNVTGWARVDENGLVHELHRESVPASEPNVRIEVTIRIVPAPVTVTRPAWATDERTESDAERRSAPARAPSGRSDGGRA
jgi:hypothetical protein